MQPLRNWKHADHAWWICFVAFYAIVPNIPFWTARDQLGLVHEGWFCISYCLVGLLALVAPRVLTSYLLMLVVAADLTYGVTKSYWISAWDLLQNVRSFQEFSGRRILAVFVALFLTAVVVAIAGLFPVEKIRGTNRVRAAACLIAFAATCLSLDFATMMVRAGHLVSLRAAAPTDTMNPGYIRDIHFTRLPIIRLVQSELYFSRVRGVERNFKARGIPVASATAQAIQYAGLDAGKQGTGQPNVVLVLVESWGFSIDPSMRNALTKYYTDPNLQTRYQVYQGTAPFFGSTIAGEGRELCGSRIGFHLVTASSDELKDCLPGRLEAMGYHTVAAHGMDGHLFSRMTWYSNIGFQERWFRENFQQMGFPNCIGTYVGTCDASIAGWIGDQLRSQQAQPRFVYWVTLNSHLPAPPPAPMTPGSSCRLTPLLAQNPALCSWFQLIDKVHASVAQVAQSALPRPTVFILVGDHAPPFADSVLRDQFSQHEVPYVLLIPRK